ncbi:alpha/beta hydrolase [Ferrovibrio sp.]|uniref:alpha/beta fold hydrolase n=1 Tax=Ferrovibrio sp. TaxID=1917215 RepID=UPI0025C34EE8|nr:alpha/beta hydrolase [Ferrovibrio sp.]
MTGQRGYLTRQEQQGRVKLSWVDFGGPVERTLVALHGRAGCGRNYAPLAQAMRDDWRIVGMDQRGHGWSDHAQDRTRAAFIEDAAAMIEHLKCGPVVLMGHSFGGVNAYQLAAKRPELVRALVIEDVGCRFGPTKPGVSWPLRWETLDQFLAFMRTTETGMDRYLLDSLVEYEDGWGFRFSGAWHDEARAHLVGDWSDDWAAIVCPILLIHGTNSWLVRRDEMDRMAALNPRCELKLFDGAGHVPHDERPEEFVMALRSFLDRSAV